MPAQFLGRTISSQQELIIGAALAGVLALSLWACKPPSIALKEREQILRESLRTIRKMIDQYAADQSSLPTALDDLVRTAYVCEVPLDPISGQRDWNLQIGESWINGKLSRGVIDVHSSAPGKGSDGFQYIDY